MADDVLYLAFDLSTQSLKAIVIDNALKVVYETSANFDDNFPNYKTTDGFIRNGDIVTSPVLMWIQSLDKILKDLSQRVDTSKIVGIGGCGQQHGTVYVQHGFEEHLKNLHQSEKLVDTLKDKFSRNDCPIWMDSSTSQYCLKMYRSPTLLQHILKTIFQFLSSH